MNNLIEVLSVRDCTVFSVPDYSPIQRGV